MAPGIRKLIIFLGFVVGVGIIYPLIMTGIFKLNLKTSIIIGTVVGIIGGVLWIVTSNLREKCRAVEK